MGTNHPVTMGPGGATCLGVFVREEIVTIHVLAREGAGHPEIARKLGITHGAVPLPGQREEEGLRDGRKSKPHREERFLPRMAEWMDDESRRDRPANVRHVHEHLVQTADYEGGDPAYRRLLRLVGVALGGPRESVSDC